ncbi:MAG: hypothetical protein IJ225_08595 [Solobacterium sp.]|nr:hypothetical protein [Solobacterium sp.]
MAEINNKNKHGSWIHTRIEDPASVTGYFILPECTCSECGYVANFERERCPHCMAVMDKKRQ